jgi:Protein of unknown function (DUF2752)
MGALGALIIWGPAMCPMNTVLGIPCPGCGLTRASLALLHGEIGVAAALHPLVFVLLPVFVVMLVEDVWHFVRGRRLALLARIPNKVWWPIFFSVLALWLGRFAGLFGGPVDPVDLSRGYLGRAIHLLFS